MPPPKPSADAGDKPLTLRGYLYVNAVSDGFNRLGLSREPSADDRRKVIDAAVKLTNEAVAAFGREFGGGK